MKDEGSFNMMCKNLKLPARFLLSQFINLSVNDFIGYMSQPRQAGITYFLKRHAFLLILQAVS